jgi:replication-associated recombination protein RarA
MQRCIATACDGDARTALNTLDMVARHVGGTGQPVTSQHVRDAMQKAHLLYDKTGMTFIYLSVSEHGPAARHADIAL